MDYLISLTPELVQLAIFVLSNGVGDLSYFQHVADKPVAPAFDAFTAVTVDIVFIS